MASRVFVAQAPRPLAMPVAARIPQLLPCGWLRRLHGIVQNAAAHSPDSPSRARSSSFSAFSRRHVQTSRSLRVAQKHAQPHVACKPG